MRNLWGRHQKPETIFHKVGPKVGDCFVARLPQAARGPFVPRVKIICDGSAQKYGKMAIN
jgi:hypothetical protein